MFDRAIITGIALLNPGEKSRALAKKRKRKVIRPSYSRILEIFAKVYDIISGA
jgi:hypothetical protein